MKQDCSNLNELNNYCHTYNIHKNKCCQLKFSLYFLLKCIEKFISINKVIYFKIIQKNISKIKYKIKNILKISFYKR